MMSEGHESNHLKELNDNRLDQIFDEEKLTEAIKKGKRKSTKKTVFISVATAVCVFILINICNIILTVNLSNQAYERTNAYIKITVPNGYISKAVDTISFLGGRSDYTISRNVGNKPVILGNRVQPFGYLPQLMVTRGQGGLGHHAGEWPYNY